MTANAADFAGSGCGRRYEKELETHFRDCLLFYLDGRIRFERYCYGEAACLVFSVWAHGFDADGNILWDREPEFESQKTAIPRVLTDIQEDGNALQFDGAFKRYVKTEEFDEDVLHMRQLLKTKLSDQDLSVRALNCLKAAEVETVGDLVRFNRNDLLKFRNFDKKSLSELDDLLATLNLHFGMDVSIYKLDKD